MGYTYNPFTEKLSPVRDSVDELTDVDTTTTEPAQNKVLKWNGANWVPGTAGDTTEFTFSINTFTDNESSLQLIGSSTVGWEITGALHFDQTYTNGPPTSGHIALTSNGGVTWGDNLTLSSPFTVGSSTEKTIYPTAKDKYITFTLNANVGTTSDTDTETVYFRNNIKWGVVSGPGPYVSADIDGLAGTAVSNDQTRSVSLNGTTGSYLLFGFPNTYTDLNAGGFRFNSIRCPFETKATVSVTNSADFTENYDVYRSTATALGNSTLTTYTSDQTIDPLYYGITSKTDTFTEGDIEGLGTNEITNDNTQIWDAVTAPAGSYLLFSFPTRLGSVAFWVGGFEGGFESSETVAVTNVNGYQENYFAWRSTNAGLGETTVETKDF